MSLSYMCAVTVGTDVYSCEVRIHLLTPLGVGNNIHSYIRTKSIFICICALYTRQPYRKSKKTWLSPGTRGGALGGRLRQKNDLDLIERSRKVSHFSLQATHPESSSERVLTARRYPKLGDQRFESMTKVCLADRSASMPTADHIVFGRWLPP